MIIPITQFADSSSGIGALGIDGKAFVIQLITFGLAFWVLQRYAFKPIIKLMDDRRKVIETGVSLGEAMQKEKVAFEKTVAAELFKARQEADGIVAQAVDTAKATVRDAEDKARDKAATIVKDAEANADQAVKRARKQLETELVGLISDATEAIIDEKVDAKKDAALIDRALAGQR